MKPPPVHIQAAARTVSDWMAQEGHEDWILLGCASSKTLIRVERSLEECRLLLRQLARKLSEADDIASSGLLKR